MIALKAKRSNKKKVVEKAEHSVSMRFTTGLMALLCLGAACGYTHTAPILTFFFVWLAFAGSYLSYFLRNRRNIILVAVTVIGILLVLALFALEMFSQFSNMRVDIFVPFIHVLSGLLVLQTFELRTRDDLELNCLIGLGLLMCTMVVGRDVTSGLAVFVYLCLAAAFLYCDTVSRTAEKGRQAPTEASSAPQPNERRDPAGSAILPVSLLPLFGVVLFFCLPRMNSIFDYAAEQMQSMMQSVSRPGGNRYGANQPLGAPVPGSYGTSKGGRGKKHGPGGKKIHQTKDTLQADQVVGEAAAGSVGASKSTTAGSKDKGGASPAKDTDTAKGNKKIAQPTKSPASDASKGPPEDRLVMRNDQAGNYDDQLLLEVSAPGEFFYKRLVLDRYDGHHWTASRSVTLSKCKKMGTSFQELAGVPSLFIGPDLQCAEVCQHITVEANLGHLIPAAAVPQKLGFPAESITVDENGVLKSDLELKKGVVYDVYSQVPNFNLPSLRRKEESAEEEKEARAQWKNCIQLPVDLPVEVTTLSQDVAGNTGNWFVKCERICKYLRTKYQYSLEGDPPVKDKQDLVDNFLFGPKKSGSCGPFASSFAVMCRVNGIPARVLGGFAPGDLNAQSGLREIYGRHSHAWVEVFIPTTGWVPFDATPGGTLPAPLEQDNSALAAMARNLAQLQATLNPASLKGPLQPVTPSLSALGAPATTPGGKPPINSANSSQAAAQAAKTAQGHVESGAGSDLRQMVTSSLGWLLKGLLVVGLLPLTLLLIQALRQGYLSIKAGRKDHASKRSTQLYLKVVNDMKRFKVNRLPSDTAQEITGRFLTAVESGTTAHPELPGTLSRFMQVYSDDRFGLPESSPERAKELEELSDKIHRLTKRSGI